MGIEWNYTMLAWDYLYYYLVQFFVVCTTFTLTKHHLVRVCFPCFISFFFHHHSLRFSLSDFLISCQWNSCGNTLTKKYIPLTSLPYTHRDGICVWCFWCCHLSSTEACVWSEFAALQIVSTLIQICSVLYWEL